MAKKNPLKLNALQLRTLTILQQMARSPNHAQPGDEEGSVLVTNFPTAHGNHFHVGDAVVLASRSEEHTSELQSLMRISYAVFCLKKNKQHKTLNHTSNT